MTPAKLDSHPSTRWEERGKDTVLREEEEFLGSVKREWVIDTTGERLNLSESRVGNLTTTVRTLLRRSFILQSVSSLTTRCTAYRTQSAQ